MTGLPFYSALLPTTSATHELTYSSPEHIVIDIPALLNSHVRYDLSKFVLLFFGPVTLNPKPFR